MDSINKLYTTKEEGYFDSVRKEIKPLIPEAVGKVLEIGCGSGATLQWIRHEYGCEWIGGVELSEESAKIAQEMLDFFVQGNIEQMELPFEPGSLDLILCLDVLEHLVDPWGVLKRLVRFLKPEGVLIVSMPNICHHSASFPMLFRDRWDYTPSGILDKTHLRFFTRKTSIELFEQAGLRVNGVLSVVPITVGSKVWLFNLLTLGRLRRFLTTQYLISGTLSLQLKDTN